MPIPQGTTHDNRYPQVPVPNAANLHEHGPYTGRLGGEEVHEDVFTIALSVLHGTRGR